LNRVRALAGRGRRENSSMHILKRNRSHPHGD
jgi:hypothetical protein